MIGALILKLSIIGKNSKIGNALQNSHLQACHQFFEYSMRSENDIQSNAEKSDAIIYLVANTKTNLQSNEYVESLYSNCFLLAKYLQINKNQIVNKPFIYMSSAKVYDLFPYSNIYSDKLLSEIVWYPVLFNVAMEIINLSNTKFNNTDIYSSLQTIINQLITKLRLNSEFPIYSFCKVVGEIIVESMVKNYFILRPTYLYGHQEKRNMVYCFIDNLFNHHDVIVSSRKRDYVTYNTLIDIIENLLTGEGNGRERILNVSSCDIVDGFKLYECAMSLLGINKINSQIKFEFEKSSDFYGVDNSSLISRLSKINKYHVETFDEGYSQIIYRYYIENISKEKIYDEFIGGSFARVYFTQNDQGYKNVYKVCLGNGADNGNTKIIHEAEQLCAVKKHLDNTNIKVIVPVTQIISKTEKFTCIKQEYIDGINYIELFKNNNNKLSLKLLEQYCEKILDIYASRLSTLTTTNMLVNNKNRIISRLISVNKKNSSIFTDFQTFKNIKINGITYENPLNVIDSLREHEDYFISKIGLCISGDPILDNFILKNGEFAFIDARGENLIWEEALPLFDPYYDLAKIYFYFYGWKQIREEQFTLSTNNYSLKDCICDFSFTGDLAYKYDMFCDECMKIFIVHKNKIWIHEDVDIFKNKILLLAGMHFLVIHFQELLEKANIYLINVSWNLHWEQN